ncbi:hypothetical protein [Granulosicoccus antarcticus]|uniref:hypothetical protein n=1 Tax=Granulosicoccus antarcticus TaxID=437505 RepID=UPI0012FDE8E4|nr:hypothetical protein [Granulosicoccus antarcticus]
MAYLPGSCIRCSPEQGSTGGAVVDDDTLDEQAGIPTSPGNLQGTVYSSTDAAA